MLFYDDIDDAAFSYAKAYMRYRAAVESVDMDAIREEWDRFSIIRHHVANEYPATYHVRVHEPYVSVYGIDAAGELVLQWTAPLRALVI